MLPLIPADFDLPILIVQRMPPLFTRFLCDRLREVTKLPVREAAQGERLDQPKILVAPGDFHMRLARPMPGRIPEVTLDQGPPENSCRPAVDTLFSSAAETFGGAIVAIVLTGMGQDGLRGVGAIKSRGGFVIVQDEATSAVWGMPRAVFHAGLADLILPLPQIVPEMLWRLASAAKRSSPRAKYDPLTVSKELSKNAKG
jgi:two-component system chemotaxis response regulator CheB